MDVTSVLVVDDDAAMATATASVLREQGHDVRTALSGGQALDDLAERRADVVVLDFEMHDMTGGEVLAAIRGDLELADTRVVIYTSYRELPELPDGVAPDAFIPKVSTAALVAAIRALA